MIERLRRGPGRAACLGLLLAVVPPLGACATAPAPAVGAGSEDPGAQGFAPIFDGRTLAGWEQRGGGATYEAIDGCIVGTVGPGPNAFLCTTRTYGDFVLRLEVRMDEPGNSGIQFRSHARDDGVVFGYQCELDPSPRAWTGGIYDESRRGWLFPLEGAGFEQARSAFRPAEWNRIEIRAEGDTLRTFVNGVPCAELVDGEDAEGFIALQVHSGEKGRIRWRHLRVRELR